jgi:hypothetical protein
MIAFTGFGKCDELAGDGLPNVVGAADPQSDAARIIVLTQVDGGRPSRASGLEIKNSTLVPA